MEKPFQLILSNYELSNHPFYIAWNAGLLKKEQLAAYASGYGRFIRIIPFGWELAGESEIADTECSHYLLWQLFDKSLNGGSEFREGIAATRPLVKQSLSNFSSYAEAVGTLYAFEAQQPVTAASKLKGIREHYKDWNMDEKYFKAHIGDDGEPALLEKKLALLNEEEQLLAKRAFADTCIGLWNALSAIMDIQQN